MALSTRVELPARVASPAHGALVAAPHGPPRLAVHLAVPRAAAGVASREAEGPQLAGQAVAYDTLAVLPQETISDLKLKLKNHGWFSSTAAGRSCLVFGDRELADAVRGSELIAESGRAHPAYLHVFVRLADVESLSVKTLLREYSLASGAQAEAALAASLLQAAASNSNLLALPPVADDADQPGSPCTATAAAADAAAAAAAAAGASEPAVDEVDEQQDAFASGVADSSHHGRAVVHLMVHKSAKVNWHHAHADAFELCISSSDTVDTLMRKIEAGLRSDVALEPGAVLIDGQPLASGLPLAAYGISKDSRVELVPHEPEPGADDDSLPDGSPSLHSPAHELHARYQAARAGLAKGQAPTLATAGTGGSYFLKDQEGRTAAVFKPVDEEPLAVNNPKGRSASSGSSDGAGSGSAAGSRGSGSEGLKRGTKPGEGATREVAAYLLDHGHFSGVPPTALVSLSAGGPGAVKVGSLQQFVESEGDCEERGYSAFPVREVHKIAVLDLRLGNADRNAGNILVRRSPAGLVELVPIDHGYCLPSTFEDISFDWMYWPQAERPFDQETLAYIDNLDAERDIAVLQAHGLHLRPECLRTLRVCTMVLRKAAAAGLSASQIAGILCREAMLKSPVEKLHANALHLARAAAAATSPSGSQRGALAAAPLDGSPAYLRALEALLDEFLVDSHEEHLLDEEPAELLL